MQSAYGIGDHGDAFGVGGLSQGSIYPYLDCFLIYGDATKASQIGRVWAAVNEALVTLNGTDCA